MEKNVREDDENIINEEVYKNIDRYTKEDLEKLLDNTNISAWIKDLEGRFIYVNKVFVDEINANTSNNDNLINKENLIGNKDDVFWDKKNADYFKRVDEYVIQTGNSIIDENNVTLDGDKKWFETYKTPLLDKENNVKLVAGFAKEITIRKKLENAFAESHLTLGKYDDLFYNSDEISNLVNNIKSDIIKRLKSDEISLIIYNKEKQILQPIVENKEYFNIYSKLNTVKLSYNELREATRNLNYEEITKLSDRTDIMCYEMVEELKIKYISTFKIEYNDEILGFLNIGYIEENLPKVKQDNFLKDICTKLGILIKNNNLKLELKQELKRRNEAEKELEEFLDTATELMAIVEPDNKLSKINDGWSKTLGWTEEECLNIKWTQVIHRDDLKEALSFIKNLMLNDKKSRISNRFMCKDGSFKWIQWSCKYNKDRKSTFVTGKDITQEKYMEEQKKIYKEALHLESIKNEFFANISHEFKTPLNIILATMQLINQHILNGKITSDEAANLNKYVSSIKQNSYRLLRLVNNLIDMTRIDTGYFDITLENHNIVNIVEDITISVANYVENKGIELIFDTEVEELVIACDPDKIERIMLNLLSNAIKYTKVNGIIKVYLSIENNNVRVSVKDNGDGISEGKLKVIFERFVQVDETLSRRNEGSGIGLSLVKSLIEMHGGKIWANSEIGKGAEFIFELPIITMCNEQIIKNNVEVSKSNVEKCIIEFSDIYDL